MGMAIICAVVIIALGAMWVSYVSRDIPPHVVYKKDYSEHGVQEAYERSCNMTVQEYDAQWPFPRNPPK